MRHIQNRGGGVGGVRKLQKKGHGGESAEAGGAEEA